MIDYNRLTRPFLSTEIKERQGKKVNGVLMVFKYIPGNFVIGRLNEIGTENWSFIVKESKEYNNEVVILGSLRIGNTVKEAYGSSTLTEGKTLGDSFKASSMLALVKASSYYNIPCIFHTKVDNKQHNHYQPPTAPQIQQKETHACMDCGLIISQAEVDFTSKYPHTYNNKTLCRECQQHYRKSSNITRVK